MTAANWLTLALAILGVLHGPGTQAILARLGRKGK